MIAEMEAGQRKMIGMKRKVGKTLRANAAKKIKLEKERAMETGTESYSKRNSFAT